MGASQSAADPKGSAPGRAAGVVSQRQRPSSGTGSSVLAQATGVEAVPDHTRRACVREMSCSSAVWSVRLSADSTWIVTGDESRRVIIWDALKAAKVREMECDGQVTAVDILADGSSVVSGDLSGHVCVWDATSGALRHRLNSDAPISAVQVSRDMALVLSADESGAVRLWQVASGAAHGEAMHCRASVNCACLTVDVSLIVTADKAPCLSIWEVCDSTSPHTHTLPGQSVCDLPRHHLAAPSDSSHCARAHVCALYAGEHAHAPPRRQSRLRGALHASGQRLVDPRHRR